MAWSFSIMLKKKCRSWFTYGALRHYHNPIKTFAQQYGITKIIIVRVTIRENSRCFCFRTPTKDTELVKRWLQIGCLLNSY